MMLRSVISIIPENRIHLVMKWFLLHFSKMNTSFVFHSEKWHPAYYQSSGELQVWFLSSEAMLLLRTLNTRTNRFHQSKTGAEHLVTEGGNTHSWLVRWRQEAERETWAIEPDVWNTTENRWEKRWNWTFGSQGNMVTTAAERKPHPPKAPTSWEVLCHDFYHPRKANKSNSPTDKAGTFMKPPEAVVEM